MPPAEGAAAIAPGSAPNSQIPSRLVTRLGEDPEEHQDPFALSFQRNIASYLMRLYCAQKRIVGLLKTPLDVLIYQMSILPLCHVDPFARVRRSVVGWCRGDLVWRDLSGRMSRVERKKDEQEDEERESVQRCFQSDGRA